MSTAPMPDPTQAADNSVTQRILALIAAAQNRQASGDTSPVMAQQPLAQPASPNPQAAAMAPPLFPAPVTAQTNIASTPPASPMAQQIAAGAPFSSIPSQPQPQQAPQVQQAPPGPGPVKRGLTAFLYGGGQALLQHAGLPTDYEKQQNAAKLAISQQAANDNSQYRQALTDLTTGKSAQLDAQNQPYTFGMDNSIPAQLRGQTFPSVVASGLLKVLSQNTGKTDVANISAGARTDVAQTNADSRERLANAQLAVRQAIADRNYGLAAKRLSLAGGNQDLRQLEYRMRAYGTGADGQPLPGVEFTADGTPVGTGTQANIRPTTNARNAGERADTMQDLAIRIRGALNDPEIRSGLGPLTGRINDIKGHAGILDGPLAELRNDLVSYGAFQAGLHPVRGIGGLQYFDKVMGGLGQTPEELLGKITSNDATAKSVQGVARGHLATNPPATPLAVHPFFSQFGGTVKP